jgi:hypothetical protein
MKDIRQFAGNMDEFTNVVVIEFKVFLLEEVFYVFQITGDEIVHPDDMISLFNEPVA